METLIVILSLVVILGAAIGYILWSKKKGRKCIGCPDSGCCSGCCHGCGSQQ